MILQENDTIQFADGTKGIVVKAEATSENIAVCVEPKPTPEIDVKLFMVREGDIYCLMRQCPVCDNTVMVTVEVDNVISKGLFRRVWDRKRRLHRVRRAKR
jgi:hypothetical protein